MAKALPQGVRADPPGWRGRISLTLLRLAAVALLLGVALAGLLGGGPSRKVAVANAHARVLLDAPDRLRNGNFYEMRLVIEARRPIADAVIAMPDTVWRDITINSMIPAPAEEAFKDREYRFHFGPLAAGERLDFKIDGQLNPPLVGRLDGQIRLLDGERPLLVHPYRLWVIP